MKAVFSVIMSGMLALVVAASILAFTNERSSNFIESKHKLTFERDIRPIFANRCAQCHNGSNGLPDILDKDTAIEKRHDIRNKILTRQMPYFGNMTESEREMVLQWIDQIRK